MYKIAKENLSALFQSIAENQELYLPVEVSGQVNYKAWTPDAKVSLETLKTVKSPKDVGVSDNGTFGSEETGENIAL